MSNTPLRSGLLRLAEFERAEVEAFAAGLSEAQRLEAGTFERWSARDHLAHISAWMGRQADRLSSVNPGQGTQDFNDEEIDAENARIYNAYHGLPWEAVLAEFRQANAALAKQVQSLSEEQLNGPYNPTGLQGQRLWRGIGSDVFMHPMTHLMQYCSERGLAGLTSRLQQAFKDSADVFGNIPEWQGLVNYNLACLYALNGQKEQARMTLAGALRLRPDLTEWSKEDPDLRSLG
ncbi:MAG TPA: DinB family protein [Anaerolineales bacterium]